MRVVTRGVSSSTTAFAGRIERRLGATAVASPAAAAWIACRREISTENPETLLVLTKRTVNRIVALLKRAMLSFALLSKRMIYVEND
jgi:hypothetical protein